MSGFNNRLDNVVRLLQRIESVTSDSVAMAVAADQKRCVIPMAIHIRKSNSEETRVLAEYAECLPFNGHAITCANSMSEATIKGGGGSGFENRRKSTSAAMSLYNADAGIVVGAAKLPTSAHAHFEFMRQKHRASEIIEYMEQIVDENTGSLGEQSSSWSDRLQELREKHTKLSAAVKRLKKKSKRLSAESVAKHVREQVSSRTATLTDTVNSQQILVNDLEAGLRQHRDQLQNSGTETDMRRLWGSLCAKEAVIQQEVGAKQRDIANLESMHAALHKQNELYQASLEALSDQQMSNCSMNSSRGDRGSSCDPSAPDNAHTTALIDAHGTEPADKSDKPVADDTPTDVVGQEQLRTLRTHLTRLQAMAQERLVSKKMVMDDNASMRETAQEIAAVHTLIAEERARIDAVDHGVRSFRMCAARIVDHKAAQRHPLACTLDILQTNDGTMLLQELKQTLGARLGNTARVLASIYSLVGKKLIVIDRSDPTQTLVRCK